MADLADMGYLISPHLGRRVPTPKAFEMNIRARRCHATPGGAELLARGARAAPGPEERAEHTSHLLTELTRQVGIVAAIPNSAQSLEQIELMRLPDARVLMIVVTRDGMIRNKVAQLLEPATQDELASIRNYVNHNFAGWSMKAIREELPLRLQEERATYDDLLRKLTKLYDQAAEHRHGAARLPGRHIVSGGSGPSSDEREDARSVSRAGREAALIELLDQFLGGAAAKCRCRWAWRCAPGDARVVPRSVSPS